MDIEEFLAGIRAENREMRVYGKVCEHCRKSFKARGIAQHLRHCKTALAMDDVMDETEDEETSGSDSSEEEDEADDDDEEEDEDEEDL